MDYEAIAKWALGPSTGASAKCIASHMIGLKSDGSYPHDGSDFDRCEKLLEQVPSLKLEFGRMADVNKYWAALVPQWEKIKASSDKYKTIQSIVRAIEDADPSHVRLGDSMSIRIGSAV